MSKVHSPHLSTHLGVPARTSNQLTEVTVGFAEPPHSWRISKLSRKHWCDKHQQRAARKWPSAVCESPPPPAKAKANIALMHGGSASTPHNVASVAAASVTMDAANAFGLAGAAHAVSAASLAAGSNSTVPLDQFYWICRACSYKNEEDISRAVFGNTDEGTHVCVICYTSSPRSSKDVDSEVKDKLLDSTK